MTTSHIYIRVNLNAGFCLWLKLSEKLENKKSQNVSSESWIQPLVLNEILCFFVLMVKNFRVLNFLIVPNNDFVIRIKLFPLWQEVLSEIQWWIRVGFFTFLEPDEMDKFLTICFIMIKFGVR